MVHRFAPRVPLFAFALIASCGSSSAGTDATDAAGGPETPGDAGLGARDSGGTSPGNPANDAAADATGAAGPSGAAGATGCRSTAAFSPTGTPPSLVAGQWKNISPAGLDLSSPDTGAPRYGATMFDVDPCNPATLYLNVDQSGMWKTTDAGATWARLGTPPATPNYSASVSYLDSPVGIRIDPANAKHLYATQGVRGQTLGFWVSEDGGETWDWPPGFKAIASTATNDVTSLAVDPGQLRAHPPVVALAVGGQHAGRGPRERGRRHDLRRPSPGRGLAQRDHRRELPARPLARHRQRADVAHQRRRERPVAHAGRGGHVVERVDVRHRARRQRRSRISRARASSTPAPITRWSGAWITA